MSSPCVSAKVLLVKKSKSESQNKFHLNNDIEYNLINVSPLHSNRNISTNLITKPIVSEFANFNEQNNSIETTNELISQEKKEIEKIILKKIQIKRKLISSSKPLLKAYNENKKFVRIFKDKLDKNISYSKIIFGDESYRPNSHLVNYTRKDEIGKNLTFSLRIENLKPMSNSNFINFNNKPFTFLTDKIISKPKNDNENIKDKNDIEILRKIFNNQIEEAEKYNCINFVALKSSKTDIYPTNEKISEFNINQEKFVNRKLSNKFNTLYANKRGKSAKLSSFPQPIKKQGSFKLLNDGLKDYIPLTKNLETQNNHKERLEKIKTYHTKLLKNGNFKQKMKKIKERNERIFKTKNVLVSEKNKFDITSRSSDVWYASFQETSEVPSLAKYNQSKELEIQKKKTHYQKIVNKIENFKYKEKSIPKNHFQYELKNPSYKKYKQFTIEKKTNYSTILETNIFDLRKKQLQMANTKILVNNVINQNKS